MQARSESQSPVDDSTSSIGQTHREVMDKGADTNTDYQQALAAARDQAFFNAVMAARRFGATYEELQAQLDSCEDGETDAADQSPGH